VDDAEGHIRHALGLVEEMEYTRRAVIEWHWLGRVTLVRGDLTAAEAYGRRALAAWEQRAVQHHIADSWLLLGEIAAERGDVAAAVALCRRARRLARRLGVVELEGQALLSQARALLHEDPAGPRRSRVRVAAMSLERVHVLVSVSGLASFDVQVTLLTAVLRRRQGAHAEARTDAEEALRVAVARGRRREDAQARRLLGECARVEGDLVAAEIHLRAALALETSAGAMLEAARTRLALAKALGRGGHRPGEALALLHEARARFAAAGAMDDLVRAERVAAEWAERPGAGETLRT